MVKGSCHSDHDLHKKSRFFPSMAVDLNPNANENDDSHGWQQKV